MPCTDHQKRSIKFPNEWRENMKSFLASPSTMLEKRERRPVTALSQIWLNGCHFSPAPSRFWQPFDRLRRGEDVAMMDGRYDGSSLIAMIDIATAKQICILLWNRLATLHYYSACCHKCLWMNFLQYRFMIEKASVEDRISIGYHYCINTT